MKLYLADQSVMPVLQRISLSKTQKEAAATLTASLCQAMADHYFQNMQLAVGDCVRLLDDNGAERFLGSIHQLERTPEEIRITAYDPGIYLTRNEVTGIYAGTGADICRKVAGQLGIATGQLDAGNRRTFLYAAANRSAFSILRAAVGDDREITIENQALTVRPRKDIVFTLPMEQVLQVSASAGLEHMVNRCTVIGRKGQILANAQDSAAIAAYGQFRQVRGTTGSPVQEAREALVGRTKTARLVLLGNLGYVCGARITANIPAWGLEGSYRIISAEHRWEDGFFTTTLNLEEDT